MSKRYALQKDVKALTKAMLELTKQVNEIAKWQAYYTIRHNLEDITPALKKEILENSKGHITHVLYERLFRGVIQ